ncbi:hypothetical protein AB6O49_08500 [Streptomyces sp. SBR177]
MLERLFLVGELGGALLQLAELEGALVEGGVEQQQGDQAAAEQQHDEQDEGVRAAVLVPDGMNRPSRAARPLSGPFRFTAARPP